MRAVEPEVLSSDEYRSLIDSIVAKAFLKRMEEPPAERCDLLNYIDHVLYPILEDDERLYIKLYNTMRKDGADEYVGEDDPFDPKTWIGKEVLRVGPNKFAAGLTVEELAGDVKIQAYRSYASGLRYQVYNENLQKYKRFKGVWVDGGFATKEEAIRNVPENFLEWITVQRLKHAA